MSLKSAPRRDVVDVRRVGDWGEVRYRHRLSCGHTEERKRPAKASVIACSACSVDKRLSRKMFLLDTGSDQSENYDLISSEFAQAEMLSVRIRGAIAARLGVTLEDVDVLISDVDGRFAVASASVHIDGQTAMRILQDWSSND